MKVYVVESGEYEDRTIDAIFTERTKAEEYADYLASLDSWAYANPSVSEWECDAKTPQRVYHYFWVETNLPLGHYLDAGNADFTLQDTARVMGHRAIAEDTEDEIKRLRRGLAGLHTEHFRVLIQLPVNDANLAKRVAKAIPPDELYDIWVADEYGNFKGENVCPHE